MPDLSSDDIARMAETSEEYMPFRVTLTRPTKTAGAAGSIKSTYQTVYTDLPCDIIPVSVSQFMQEFPVGGRQDVQTSSFGYFPITFQGEQTVVKTEDIIVDQTGRKYRIQNVNDAEDDVLAADIEVGLVTL